MIFTKFSYFQPFWDLKHHFLVREQFGGIPSDNLPVNRHQIRKVWYHKISSVPYSLVPWLRTYDLINSHN